MNETEACSGWRHIIMRAAASEPVQKAYATVRDLRSRGSPRQPGFFIVLAHPRTGSNLVTMTLNRHTQVVAHGELFEPQGAHLACAPWPFNRSRWARLVRDRDVESFLGRYVFCRYASHIRAVGLKLMYHHLTGEAWRSHTVPLLDRPGVRLIRVQRDNKLACHLSMVRALKGGVWLTRTPGTGKEAPLTLDPDECRDAFVRLQAADADLASMCVGRDHRVVRYHDLTTDLAGEMQKLQTFLDVDTQPLTPLLHRQRTTPLRDSIANHDELAAHFADTPWSSFFDDQS